MSDSAVTYIFRNGQTFAVHQGKVIAASDNPDEVESQVKLAFGGTPPEMHGPPSHGGPTEMPPPPAGLDQGMDQGETCPECGGQIDPATGMCIGCGRPQAPTVPGGDMYGPGHGGYEGYEGVAPEERWAKTVITPNGLKGTVLGKVAGIWGEEVTVRLENGRIVKLPVGTELHAQKTAASPRANPIEQLGTRLAATPDGTRDSLVSRSEELETIKKHASRLIREGAAWAEAQQLNQIVVTADVEQLEIIDAVAHLDDVSSYQAPGFSMQAAGEAAGISREDASWLDDTLDQMVAEAEATDYQKLMDEGPEALTAELPDSALADSSVTHQLASSFILEKTAGVTREAADPYMQTFLARVEQCRRAELDNRKQPIEKEAAVEEDQYGDVPDDAIFLS